MTIQGVSQIRTILMKAKSGRVFHKTPKLLLPSSMKRIHSFFSSLIVRGGFFSIRIVPKGISEPKRILSAEAGTSLKINTYPLLLQRVQWRASGSNLYPSLCLYLTSISFRHQDERATSNQGQTFKIQLRDEKYYLF
jgi:hypothetical protein